MSIGTFIACLAEKGYIRSTRELTNPFAVTLRCAAIPIVRIAVWLGIHPNVITILSFLLGCYGAYRYSQGEFLEFVAAWTLAVVLDYADGTVARLTGCSSYVGYLLDMLTDRIKLVCLLIAWAWVENSRFAYVLVLMAIVFLLLHEVLTHLFVDHEPAGVAQGRKPWIAAVYEMFVAFDMHSFLLYGVLLACGHVIGILGTTWLNIILLNRLLVESRRRLLHKGKASALLNERYARLFRR